MPDQHTTRTDSGDEARPSTSETESTSPDIADAERLQQAAARIAELEDNWRRALADLDNLRKRFAREVQRERANERARVVAEWLPILDHLELALDHAGADPDALVEGVRAVRDQAAALIERLGFTRIDEVGVPFDPTIHEAIATVVDPDAAPGTVVHVVRPGYGRGDSQLRPARVVVATKDG